MATKRTARENREREKEGIKGAKMANGGDRELYQDFRSAYAYRSPGAEN